MKVRHLFLLLALLCSCQMSAQTRFTQRLQSFLYGKGLVTLHQDSVISALIDGILPCIATDVTSYGGKKQGGATHVGDDFDSVATSVPVYSGVRTRVNGFRIQVYAGGNSREAKLRAEQMEYRVRSFYPDMATYTRFVSPRWICHLGDFVSREEAMQVLEDLRARGGFAEAIIVKCKVNAMVSQ